MRTLHPFVSFRETAAILNKKQLSEQCLVAKQLLLVLEGTLKINPGYESIQMWSGYEEALALYGWIMATELGNRGQRCKFRGFFGERMPVADFPFPHWLEDEEFMEVEAARLNLQ